MLLIRGNYTMISIFAQVKINILRFLQNKHEEQEQRSTISSLSWSLTHLDALFSLYLCVWVQQWINDPVTPLHSIASCFAVFTQAAKQTATFFFLLIFLLTYLLTYYFPWHTPSPVFYTLVNNPGDIRIGEAPMAGGVKWWWLWPSSLDDHRSSLLASRIVVRHKPVPQPLFQERYTSGILWYYVS